MSIKSWPNHKTYIFGGWFLNVFVHLFFFLFVFCLLSVVLYVYKSPLIFPLYTLCTRCPGGVVHFIFQSVNGQYFRDNMRGSARESARARPTFMTVRVGLTFTSPNFENIYQFSPAFCIHLPALHCLTPDDWQSGAYLGVVFWVMPHLRIWRGKKRGKGEKGGSKRVKNGEMAKEGEHLQNVTYFTNFKLLESIE